MYQLRKTTKHRTTNKTNLQNKLYFIEQNEHK